MSERNVIERLDELVEVLLSSGALGPVVGADLAMLATVAADLRDLPSAAFKSRLKKQLFPDMEETMSAVAEVKPGLHTITPYFVVNGAQKLIDFIVTAFGGEVQGRYPRPDDMTRLMHAEVRIGDSIVEMGDANDMYSARTMGIHLYVPNVDEVFERAVGAGGRVLMPVTDQPYGDREASIADPLGNHWYIATHQATGSRPEGFATVTMFLHPKGASELMDFLADAFDATELERTASPEGMIHHATMSIGNSMVELGEAHGQWGPMPAQIHLFVPDADAVFQQAIAAGATELYPLEDKPYGERSGGVTDAWGNQWFIATPK